MVPSPLIVTGGCFAAPTSLDVSRALEESVTRDDGEAGTQSQERVTCDRRGNRFSPRAEYV